MLNSPFGGFRPGQSRASWRTRRHSSRRRGRPSPTPAAPGPSPTSTARSARRANSPRCAALTRAGSPRRARCARTSRRWRSGSAPAARRATTPSRRTLPRSGRASAARPAGAATGAWHRPQLYKLRVWFTWPLPPPPPPIGAGWQRATPARPTPTTRCMARLGPSAARKTHVSSRVCCRRTTSRSGRLECF